MKATKENFFIKGFLNWNYEFFQKYFGYFGVLSSILHIAFLFILVDLVGYKENTFFRVSSALLPLFFLLLPKDKSLKTWQKIYIELTFVYALPALFAYTLLLNDANNYWFSSLVFCGLLYGLLAQPLIGLVNLILSFTAVMVIFNAQYGLSEEVFSMSLQAYLVALTMYILSAFLRSMIQSSFYINLKLTEERTKSEHIRKNFQKLKAREEVIKRYVRPSLLTELALGKDPLKYPTQKITTGIIFVDMRSYTSFAEKHSVEETHDILNTYFEILNDAVFKHHGEVDKIMGDAIMATVPSSADCLQICKEMWEGLSKKNKFRYERSQMPVRFGAGISYGEVLSGNFGSKRKYDRTIVGDIVNVGSRLEQLTKTYKVDILATEDFIQGVKDYPYYRLIDQVYVKGKNIPINVYELFEHNHRDVREFKLSHAKQLEKIVHLKCAGKYQEALELMEELIQICPNHRYEDSRMMDETLFVLQEMIIELKNNHSQKDAA